MRHFLETMARETIVVNQPDGTSIRGVLIAVHRDCLVLAHARVLGAEADTPLDGQAVIERSKVAWIQRLSPPEA